MENDPNGKCHDAKKKWFKRMQANHISMQLKQSDPKKWKKLEKKQLQKQMGELERQDKLGRWEIENCERKRVARIYLKARSK